MVVRIDIYKTLLLLIVQWMLISCGQGQDGNNHQNGLDASLDSGSDADIDVDSGNGNQDGSVDGSVDSGSNCNQNDIEGCRWRLAKEGPVGFLDIWGRSEDDIYVLPYEEPPDEGPVDCPADYYLLHYDGTSWKEMDLSNTNLDIHPCYLMSIWGTEQELFIASLRSNVIIYDGTDWKEAKKKDYRYNYILGIWGSSAEDIYIVGDAFSGGPLDIVSHYDGNEWSEVYTQSNASGGINSIWGSSSNDVYANRGPHNEGRLLHFDGTTWDEMDVSSDVNQYFNDIWGTAEDDVFAVGIRDTGPFEYSRIWHFDGNEWEVIFDEIPEYLERIGGSAWDDVYFAGRIVTPNEWLESVIYHYDGVDLTRMELDCPWVVNALWAGSKDQAYAVGSDLNTGKGVILKYSCE